jgi:two-component system KDP operon response regulator KdpE
VLVHLSPLEYRLLALLIRSEGKVLTHHQMLREIWGPEHVESSPYLRVYVGNLRRKLETDPARPRHILTETGIGYRFVR